MNTKLTLRLDDSLIETAKQYSASNGKSLSQTVADYFTVIKNEHIGQNTVLTPTVRSLKGVLEHSGVTEADYHQHLEDKHL